MYGTLSTQSSLIFQEKGMFVGYNNADFQKASQNITPSFSFGGLGLHVMKVWVEALDPYRNVEPHGPVPVIPGRFASLEPTPPNFWGVAYVVFNQLSPDGTKYFQDEHWSWSKGEGAKLADYSTYEPKDNWAAMWTFPMGFPRAIGRYLLHMEGISTGTLVPVRPFHRTFILEVRDWETVKIESAIIQVGQQSSSTVQSTFIPSDESAVSPSAFTAGSGGGSTPITDLLSTRLTPPIYFNPVAEETVDLRHTIRPLPQTWEPKDITFRVRVGKEGVSPQDAPGDHGIVFDSAWLPWYTDPLQVRYRWDGKATRNLGKTIKAGKTVPGGRYIVFWELKDPHGLTLRVTGPLLIVGRIALDEIQVSAILFDPAKGNLKFSTSVHALPKEKARSIEELRVWLEILETRSTLDDESLIHPEDNRVRRVWERIDFIKRQSYQGPGGKEDFVPLPPTVSLEFAWDGRDEEQGMDESLPLTTNVPATDYVVHASREPALAMGPYTIIISARSGIIHKNAPPPPASERTSVRKRIVLASPRVWISSPQLFPPPAEPPMNPYIYEPQPGVALRFPMEFRFGLRPPDKPLKNLRFVYTLTIYNTSALQDDGTWQTVRVAEFSKSIENSTFYPSQPRDFLWYAYETRDPRGDLIAGGSYEGIVTCYFEVTTGSPGTAQNEIVKTETVELGRVSFTILSKELDKKKKIETTRRKMATDSEFRQQKLEERDQLEQDYAILTRKVLEWEKDGGSLTDPQYAELLNQWKELGRYIHEEFEPETGLNVPEHPFPTP